MMLFAVFAGPDDYADYRNMRLLSPFAKSVLLADDPPKLAIATAPRRDKSGKVTWYVAEVLSYSRE